MEDDGQAIEAVTSSLAGFVETLGGTGSVEELEQAYLEEARRFIDCRAVGFYVLGPQGREAEQVGASGVSDRFLSRYEEWGRLRDPVLSRVLETRSAVHNGELMGADQWRSLEVYREVFQLHRMIGLLEAPVIYDGRVIGTLNFGADEDSEPFTEEHTALASSLGRLVGMTLGSLWQREKLYEERERLISVLDLCDEAMIMTDPVSGKLRSNAAARAVLEQLSDGVEAPYIDELLAAGPLEKSSEKGARIEQVEVTLSNGRDAVLRLHSMPVPESEEAVVCFLSLRGGEVSLPPAVRRSLTTRECEVASLVARGLQDSEIAERLYLSPFTVKQYLKDTYRKLGLRSRVELALLSEYRTHSV